MKTVYTCFCTDIIHEGHLNIIREARKYGEVTVGILSDNAMVRYNRFPSISLQERINLVKDLDGVSNVIVQEKIMYDEIFETLHPDYVVHGVCILVKAIQMTFRTESGHYFARVAATSECGIHIDPVRVCNKPFYALSQKARHMICPDCVHLCVMYVICITQS
jgi:cytidyltransferase-like protein